MSFHGTLGEIDLNEDENYVKLKKYAKGEEKWNINELGDASGAHGGGDIGLVSSLYDMIMGAKESKTSLSESIESHLMAISAEESRLEGGTLKFVH